MFEKKVSGCSMQNKCGNIKPNIN